MIILTLTELCDYPLSLKPQYYCNYTCTPRFYSSIPIFPPKTQIPQKLEASSRRWLYLGRPKYRIFDPVPLPNYASFPTWVRYKRHATEHFENPASTFHRNYSGHICLLRLKEDLNNFICYNLKLI